MSKSIQHLKAPRLSRLGSRARAVAAIACALVTASAHADLITNGSFETPLVPAGSYKNYPAPSTDITGWTVVGVDSAVTSTTFTQNGITFEAQDGIQWVDLAGVTSNSKSSGVTQTIATVVGSTYALSFYVGSATDGSVFFASTVDLSIDGGPRVSYNNPTAPRDHLDWKNFVVDFVATGTTTRLTFLNGDEPDNYSTALDNVSVDLVTPTIPPPTNGTVPEPSPLALLCLGLVAATTLRRRSATAS